MEILCTILQTWSLLVEWLQNNMFFERMGNITPFIQEIYAEQPPRSGHHPRCWDYNSYGNKQKSLLHLGTGRNNSIDKGDLLMQNNWLREGGGSCAWGQQCIAQLQRRAGLWAEIREVPSRRDTGSTEHPFWLCLFSQCNRKQDYQLRERISKGVWEIWGGKDRSEIQWSGRLDKDL